MEKVVIARTPGCEVYALRTDDALTIAHTVYLVPGSPEHVREEVEFVPGELRVIARTVHARCGKPKMTVHVDAKLPRDVFYRLYGAAANVRCAEDIVRLRSEAVQAQRDLESAVADALDELINVLTALQGAAELLESTSESICDKSRLLEMLKRELARGTGRA